MNCEFKEVEKGKRYKCEICGYVYIVKHTSFNPERIFRECSGDPLPALPPLKIQATNFFKELVGYTADGFNHRSPEEYKECLDACSDCIFLKEDKKDARKSRCNQCGCYVIYKSRMRKTKCPLGKWPTTHIPKEITVPLLYTKNGNPAFLKDHFLNQSCFYIGGGPSLNEIDLSILSSRGIMTLAVNN
ncbi:unnamed protein product, partial [marine sediment metagenome]